MAKKRCKTKKMASAGDTKTTSNTGSDVENYDMNTSQRRLMEQGFHPAVTSSTPEEVERKWLSRIDPLIDRVTLEQFMRQRKGLADESAVTPRHLTTAMLLFRSEIQPNRAAKQTTGTGDNTLATILNTVDVGGEIANRVFRQGWKSVLNAAVTSSATWEAVANSAKIWDFNASGLRADGSSGVFLAVTPECTIEELNTASGIDPYGLGSAISLSGWSTKAIKYEREIYLSIYLIYNRIMRKSHGGEAYKQKRKAEKIIPVDFMTQEILSAVKNIREIKGIWGTSPFVRNFQNQLFRPSAIFAATRLRRMLNHISQQRTALRVLYFEKIPFLDRRMIAVILRECPNVCMVGIYDCPLIHFGDVLCLIDLIYEVNHGRREAGFPEITAFDFYPRYNHGTPFQSATSATYGLTWGPHKLDVVQRGFFNIILKGFMKAKKMNLGLLFDKDKAFCEYLDRVPCYPLAVPIFLDALHRFCEARDEDSKTKAMYDLLKPVRLGLDRWIEYDQQTRYVFRMRQNLVFCSSCGYETLEEFYSALARDSRPHRRVCAGCILQRWLDEEADHLKGYKKQALNTLYPDWNGLDFNNDAPMPQVAKGMIRLRSTVSVRPNINCTTVDHEGVMYTRQVMLDLLRDNKIHWDSLKRLPKLVELLSNGTIWGDFYNKCNNLDVYGRAVRCVAEQDEQREEKSSFIRSRFDGGMPDTDEELQRPARGVVGIPCHDLDSAVMFYAGLTTKGWGAREQPAEKHCYLAEKLEDAFW
ncbi:hypothetical protein ED733_006514 [Metarhizium rileyi]|uniref:Ribosomal protein L36 n=1 Tax=Metarhizium rileyi (strain RCEF 4871) TaxID=1649241 RepID=A0A5C6GEJ2_METRR|nr:hypothetical protein ED733_006514 [Metarhizium rileyi]